MSGFELVAVLAVATAVVIVVSLITGAYRDVGVARATGRDPEADPEPDPRVTAGVDRIGSPPPTATGGPTD